MNALPAEGETPSGQLAGCRRDFHGFTLKAALRLSNTNPPPLATVSFQRIRVLGDVDRSWAHQQGCPNRERGYFGGESRDDVGEAVQRPQTYKRDFDHNSTCAILPIASTISRFNCSADPSGGKTVVPALYPESH